MAAAGWANQVLLNKHRLELKDVRFSGIALLKVGHVNLEAVGDYCSAL